MGTSLPSSKGTEKVLPRYLRASTNSCHDFCKYGRKHAFETKEKRPIRRKVIKDAGNSIEGQDQMKNVHLGENKKKPMVKLKATPELNIELLEKPKILMQKALPSVKKIEISIKPAIASKQRSVTAKSSLPSNQSGVPSGRSRVNSPSNPFGGLHGIKKRDNIPLSPSGNASVRKSSGRSPSNHSSGLSGGRYSENHSSSPSGGILTVRRSSEKRIVQSIGLSKSGERKALKPPMSSLSPKPSVNRVPSLKAMSYRSPKMVSPKINRNRDGKAEPNTEQEMEKTLYVIEPEDKSLKPVEQDETINRASRSTLSLSSLSSCPSLSSDDEEEVDEESGSELTDGDNTGEQDKTEKNRTEDSKGGDRRRLRRSAMTEPEDKDCAPQKLKFQRGKVVSLDPEKSGPRKLRFRRGRVVGQNHEESESSGLKKLKFRQGRVVGENQEESENSGLKKLKFRQGRLMGENQEESENSSLKRLKFRQGRVMGENQESSENSGLKRLQYRQGRVMGASPIGKASIGRRSFRRNRDLGGGDANATKAGTPNVVLRHQDVQGKKEEQHLFNDVIEETANKLVETRKSKVKALVGAFETVISLQESKPAATV